MTQENKDQLLKDLCARLPYGVKARVYNQWRDEAQDETITIENLHRLIETFSIENIKPYLFPQSNMTQEQMVEYYNTLFVDDKGNKYLTVKSTDWLYKNHIDIYGFISMGLAIDATGLNVY